MITRQYRAALLSAALFSLAACGSDDRADDQRTAVGRDIWGGGSARREVYVLQAVVRPGDSGGPFVAADGTVLGLVFARSNVHSDVGYALTSEELRPALAALTGATEPVATGRCVD